VTVKDGDPETTSPPYKLIFRIKSSKPTKVVSICEIKYLQPLVHLNKIPLKWFELRLSGERVIDMPRFVQEPNCGYRVSYKTLENSPGVAFNILTS
jgi:hypothetical protein